MNVTPERTLQTESMLAQLWTSVEGIVLKARRQTALTKVDRRF